MTIKEYLDKTVINIPLEKITLDGKFFGPGDYANPNTMNLQLKCAEIGTDYIKLHSKD